MGGRRRTFYPAIMNMRYYVANTPKNITYTKNVMRQARGDGHMLVQRDQRRLRPIVCFRPSSCVPLRFESPEQFRVEREHVHDGESNGADSRFAQIIDSIWVDYRDGWTQSTDANPS